MSKNTIEINGTKLRSALEAKSGMSVYDLAEAEGFSRNFLAQACRSGKASPIVQSVANKYSVRVEEYRLTKELKQMTIEDIGAEEYKDRLNIAIKVSDETINRISEAANKAAEDLRKAFEDLSKRWNKAVENYTEEINKIREGK